MRTQTQPAGDNGYLQVRHDPARAESSVQYRFLELGDDDGPWSSTPFQTANVQGGQAINIVAQWLDDQGEGP